MEFLEIAEIFYEWDCQLFTSPVKHCILDGNGLYGDFFGGNCVYCHQEIDIWGSSTGVGIQYVRDDFHWRGTIILPGGYWAVYWKNLCRNKEKAALYCQ